jgi:hypothetical protein
VGRLPGALFNNAKGKKMKRNLLAAGAAACLLVAMQGATAATASTTLSDFRITLVDLDPGDGITPWVTFTQPAVATTYLSVYGSPVVKTSATSASGWGPVSTSAAPASYTDASASLSGDPFTTGATLAASARNDLLPPTFPWAAGVAGQVTFGASVFGNDFQLSPNTRLVISADALEQADTRGTPHMYAENVANLTLYRGAPRLGSSLGQDIATEAFESSSAHLETSFENSSATTASGLFLLIDTASVLEAVPEPASALMFSLGFLALAGIRRSERA